MKRNESLYRANQANVISRKLSACGEYRPGQRKENRKRSMSALAECKKFL
jgi:hypothetical protein